ncbi:MAG: hypothetical protein GEV11_18530 [Streptosporangiales bacterium]|nr:hypothetical protein [Streptosporangiales bacterium]
MDLLGLGVIPAAVVSTVVYGLAFLYQGARRIPVGMLFGALLTAVYVLTGSMLLPVALAVVITCRDLLSLPAPAAPAAEPGRA